MALLDAIKSALGFSESALPTDGGPFRLGPEADRVVGTYATGRALHVTAVPVAGGFAVRAHEGPGEGRIVIAPEDRARLQGIVLDHDGDRFVPRPVLTVTALETPNPEGRKYETDRFLAWGRPQEFRPNRIPLPPLAARILAVRSIVAVLFNRHTLTVLREPGASWEPIDRAVETALREHLLLGGPLVDEAVLTQVPDSDLAADVERIIAAKVLDKVHRDGGDLQLVGVVDGVVRLRLVGACRACPASRLTLQAGVRLALEEALPGRIRAVEAVDPSDPTEP